MKRYRSSILRIGWIDALRGFGILMVTLGHCAPPFNRFIYGFHMPLFFMISGYLYNKKKEAMPLCLMVRKLAKSYLIPYFLLCFINLGLTWLLYLTHVFSEYHFEKYIVGILYSKGSREWLPNCSPLWFLTCLFCAELYFYGFRHIKHRLARNGILLLIIMISIYFSSNKLIRLPWNADSALMGMLFMVFGYNLREMGYLDKIKRRWDIKIFGICIVGGICIVFNTCTISMSNAEYGNVILMILGAGSISLALFILFQKLYRNTFLWKYLSFWGKHTILIMGFDYFAGTLSEIALRHVNSLNWITEFLLKLVLLLLIIGLVKLLKINKKPNLNEGV